MKARELVGRVHEAVRGRPTGILVRPRPPIEEAAHQVLVPVVPRALEGREEPPDERPLARANGNRGAPAVGELAEGGETVRQQLEDGAGGPRRRLRQCPAHRVEQGMGGAGYWLVTSDPHTPDRMQAR